MRCEAISNGWSHYRRIPVNKRLLLDVGLRNICHHKGQLNRRCANNPQEGEMKFRQDTVAEGCRVISTEELRYAAFDVHLIGMDAEYDVYVGRKSPDSALCWNAFLKE